MTDPRSVAYLENSLKVQKAGCRPALHQRLEQHWEVPMQQVNAGLGGVGSLACICLLESIAVDMLGATSPAQLGPSLELSVREVLAAAVEPVLLHLPWRRSEPAQRANTLGTYYHLSDYSGIWSLRLWNRWLPHDDALLEASAGSCRLGGPPKLCQLNTAASAVFVIPTYAGGASG